MNVLSLCDLTGTMVEPWLAAGHDCFTVDLENEGPQRIEHESGGTLTKLAHNVSDLVSRSGASLCDWVSWGIVFAFPPCDHLATSGARWFKGKGMGKLIEALEIVEACRTICDAAGAPYFIENPNSTLATYWRTPNARIEPWHFNLNSRADTYWKDTCLWWGNGFAIPERNVDPRTILAMQQAAELFPEIKNRGKLIKAVRECVLIDSDWFPDDRMHKAPPGEGRKNFRSATPRGFAHAVFAANAPKLESAGR